MDETTMECSRKSDEIRAEVERRRIGHVLHFSQVRRLADIANLGLLSKAEQGELGIGSRYGSKRWDGNDRAISVSISSINYRMFKSKEKGHEIGGWVVLVEGGPISGHRAE
jgi:hypothetical protein